ncbi:MAG TPA: hypothetical protein VIH89_04580 [Candidatus Sulfotelmatobacter sp.]
MTCTRCNCAVVSRFGTYGKRRVQRFRCASCKKTFAEPQPKFGNHYIEPAKAAKILEMMMEGCSIRSISRLMDIDKGTVLACLKTAGERCSRVWDAYMRNISTRLVQADRCGAMSDATSADSGPTLPPNGATNGSGTASTAKPK